jgi:hypothetical protein
VLSLIAPRRDHPLYPSPLITVFPVCPDANFFREFATRVQPRPTHPSTATQTQTKITDSAQLRTNPSFDMMNPSPPGPSSLGSNPRDILANLLQHTHPNIAWAIRRGTACQKNFKANDLHADLVGHAADFLIDVEAGLQLLYDTNSRNEKTIESLNAANAALTASMNTQTETITALRASANTQTETIAALRASANNRATDGAKKKCLTKDPPVFTGKGAPTERQAEFETWLTKIRSVLDRDWAYFDTPHEQIQYVGDRLEGKAFEFVKQGLDTLHENPRDPTQWHWTSCEDMLKQLSDHYKVIDTSQVSKRKLDKFPQGDRNYWSWKAELDEHMNKAKKTKEQKVDLLRKFVSPKMQELALTLHHEIPGDDYAAWSKQMDVFAKNLANHAHLASLDKSTDHRHQPQIPPAPVPAPTGEANKEPRQPRLKPA